MMTCKAYNLLKEIFHHLCNVLCSKYNTQKVENSKEKLVQLTDDFRANFMYDVIAQSQTDLLSENESVYDNDESIFKQPIYKGSIFYEHLITEDDEEDGIVVANKFFKVELVEAVRWYFAFMDWINCSCWNSTLQQ